MSNLAVMVETVKVREEVVNLQIGEILDWNRVDELKDNALLKVKPELWVEWDFEKNNELGLDIWVLNRGSHKNAWWNCKNCNNSYIKEVRRKDCKYCNSLLSKKPELASEWHPTKNGDLTPNDVTSTNSRKVWWVCSLKHEWKSSINNRSNQNTGCPYCTNRRLLIGFNDMWTTNPELARQLLDPDDGYKYM